MLNSDVRYIASRDYLDNCNCYILFKKTKQISISCRIL